MVQARLLTFLIWAIKVLGQSEAVGNLQRLPNNETHKEASDQLGATAIVLTVLDNLQGHLCCHGYINEENNITI